MTELIWDGKYKDGKKTAAVRLALPFQTIETVNESSQQRQKTLDFFAAGKPTDWRNRLIWGDKKYVLPSLLPEFAGKVNLIYIDPPFDTGANFSFTATIPDNPDTDEDETTQFVKQPSIIEQKAYRDTWGRGLDSYLQWFYETAVLLRELLTEDGSIYVHLDWHVGHYAKAVLDEVFGYDNFRNEIVWSRTNAHNYKSKGYIRSHDILYYYTKGSKYTWNQIYTEYGPEQLKRYRPDENGRLYTGQDLTFTGKSSDRQFEWRGVKPGGGRVWGASLDQLEKWWKEGRILKTKDGKPRLDGYKMYLDEAKGRPVTSIWDDLDRIGNTSGERIDYPTQKPESLLERIIKASSNEGDLILDCFCGSGTTAATAEKLGRHWVTCDLGRFSIHTARKRFLQIENVKPFVVQNLGKYERHQWMQTEFDNPNDRVAQETAYRNFILDLYHAQSLTGYTWLHGTKAGRMVHVGGVDAPVAPGDVKSIIQEFWNTVGKSKETKTNGIDILGWDFAFELNEMATSMAAENKINLRFRKIPREVLEKKAVEQGDIKFFELAYLDVKTKKEKKKITLSLENFVVPPDDIPAEVMQNITHWSQWIDYWAVDWNYRDDTFHNEWQSYRTRQSPKLETQTNHTYEAAGTYTVLVKVIDILGNDTTKALHVTV